MEHYSNYWLVFEYSVQDLYGRANHELRGIFAEKESKSKLISDSIDLVDKTSKKHLSKGRLLTIDSNEMVTLPFSNDLIFFFI